MKISVAKAFTLSALFLSFLGQNSFALTTGSISGTVNDDGGVAVGDANVSLYDLSHNILKTTKTSGSGSFEFYPVDFGDYEIEVVAPTYKTLSVRTHVASGAASTVDFSLLTGAGATKEITVKVQAKRKLVSSSTNSSHELGHEAIEQLPQGDNVKLPKLIATTNPGVVQGPFGQTFIRGNHANIQYQIDGVQLPDSPSNTFGQAFSPRNIDHMEVITGGIPSEYGERLAAVVNIITKTGTETPSGSAEIGYGSYNTLTPQMNYGGSNKNGDFHYFFSAAYTKTDRGLDTPQPTSASDNSQGGKDTVHDDSNANDEFAKLDWQLDNTNKVSLIAYNSYSFYQIPNYPQSFGPNSTLFTQPDQYGNDPLPYLPYNTNDTQAENNAYIEAVWKNTLSEHSFLQIAPYYKFSKEHVTNDPPHDLAAATVNGGLSNADSFSENRSTNSFGAKADYSNRLNDTHLIKAGVQLQASHSFGDINLITQQQGSATTASSNDSDPTDGYFESAYIQDEIKISKPLTVNAGLRFDATQFKFSDINSNDSWWQPRLGASYMISETTKIHAFYGLLFQPAPVENLRNAFVFVTGNPQLAPYDIKAEKDNYWELGVTQQVGDHVLGVTSYYKSAKNMLDDSQLLNTSIAQPFNFAEGYAYGVEVSASGKFAEHWSDYANYSFEIAKGKGISGGAFSQPDTSTDYQYLDHVQVHTANAGVIYQQSHYLWSAQGVFGSGLRTGDNNSVSLPCHLTFDTTLGYDFTSDSWMSKFKVALDVINIFDNSYPITIANGFNGSHYAAGRQFYVRLAKDL